MKKLKKFLKFNWIKIILVICLFWVFSFILHLLIYGNWKKGFLAAFGLFIFIIKNTNAITIKGFFILLGILLIFYLISCILVFLFEKSRK